MRKAGLILFACLLLAAVATASDLRPLSPEDFAKVQELLKSFDPNSYDIHLRVQDTKGRVNPFQSGRAIGLANIRQMNTVRPAQGSSASLTVPINIFKTASSVTVINVFKEFAPAAASSQRTKADVDPTISGSITIIARNPNLQSKAQQLNQILQKYYAP